MGKIRRIVGSLFRRPIDFSDQLRTEPISRKFGFDRGCPIDRYYIDSFLKQNQNLITGYLFLRLLKVRTVNNLDMI